jgi:YesN/AraC family two-component response regulator
MKNLKVMIVDDEEMIREGISNGIDWKLLGMEVSFLAENAIEALNYMKENLIDIVITDIKMPVMDGIMMIEKICDYPIKPEFIVLSGFAEFEYAKRAMGLGVKDYILKPVHEKELVEVLSKVKEEIEKRHREEIIIDKQTQFKSIKDKIHKNTQFSDTITEIIQLIEREIDNELLSLKWISKHKVYMSENYLSRQFKKEVGTRFSEYLTEQRMQLAMFLIASQEFTVMEVAEKVGYGNNPRYFCNVFKKYTKLTPKEYKNTIHNH